MIFGVANKRSIAWACALACAAQEAKLAFTYQGERLKENVEKLAGEIPGSLIVPCDVTDQASVDAAFEAVGKKYGKLDFVIHSIAYAPKEALEGEFVTTTREAFRTALEISAFSLTQVALAASPLMTMLRVRFDKRPARSATPSWSHSPKKRPHAPSIAARIASSGCPLRMLGPSPTDDAVHTSANDAAPTHGPASAH